MIEQRPDTMPTTLCVCTHTIPSSEDNKERLGDFEIVPANTTLDDRKHPPSSWDFGPPDAA